MAQFEQNLDNFAPIAVLVDTLKKEDVPSRVKVIEQLDTFGMVLGPIRSREEMIPFIKGTINLKKNSWKMKKK